MARYVSAIVCGRRHCAVCGRWRSITDFPPRKWNPDGTIKYIQSCCRSCLRLYQRKHNAEGSEAYRRRRRIASRTWHRRKRRQTGKPEHGARVVNTHGKRGSTVRREPFAKWLAEKLQRMNQIELSNATEMPVRRIKAVLDGYEYTGRWARSDSHHRRKLRPLDFVELETVDRALQNFGEPPDKIEELYPDAFGGNH